MRAALAKAKGEHEALAYAAERAGQELDRMPRKRRREWLQQARRDFQAARAEYEQRLDGLAEARERLAEEAALVNFLAGGQAIRVGPSVRVHAAGVEALANDVKVSGVLVALRDELTDLELEVLRGSR